MLLLNILPFGKAWLTFYDKRTLNLGWWWDRASPSPYYLPWEERLLCSDGEQWTRHRGAMSSIDNWPRLPRWDDAWHVRSRNPTAHQGHIAADSRHHGDKKRGGGRHHGSGHRQKNWGIPHQVNHMQIFHSLKKNIHTLEIVFEMTHTGYQQNLQNRSMKISDWRRIDDWKEVFKLLIQWELELSAIHPSITEMLKM